MIPEQLQDFIEKFIRRCENHAHAKTYGLNNWVLGGSTGRRAALGRPYDQTRDADFYLLTDDSLPPQNRTYIGNIIVDILSQMTGRKVAQDGPGVYNAIIINQSDFYYSIKIRQDGKDLYDFNIGAFPIYLNVHVGVHLVHECVTYSTKFGEFHEADFQEYQDNKTLIAYELASLRGGLEREYPHLRSIYTLASIIKTCHGLIQDEGAHFSRETAREMVRIIQSTSFHHVRECLINKLKFDPKGIEDVLKCAQGEPARAKAAQAQAKLEEKQAKETYEAKISELEELKNTISTKNATIKATEESHGAALVKVETAQKKTQELAQKLKDTEKNLNKKIQDLEEEKNKALSKQMETEIKYQAQINDSAMELTALVKRFQDFSKSYEQMRTPMVRVKLIQALLREPVFSTKPLTGLQQADDALTASLHGGSPAGFTELSQIYEVCSAIASLGEHAQSIFNYIYQLVTFEPAPNSSSATFPRQLFLLLDTELDNLSATRLPAKARYQIVCQIVNCLIALMHSPLMSQTHKNHLHSLPALKILGVFLKDEKVEISKDLLQFLIYIDEVKNYLLENNNATQITKFFKGQKKKTPSVGVQTITAELSKKAQSFGPKFFDAINYGIQQAANHLEFDTAQVQALLNQVNLAQASSSSVAPLLSDGLTKFIRTITAKNDQVLPGNDIQVLGECLNGVKLPEIHAIAVLLRECVISNDFSSVVSACTFRFLLARHKHHDFDQMFGPWEKLFQNKTFRSLSGLSEKDLASLTEKITSIKKAYVGLVLLKDDLSTALASQAPLTSTYDKTLLALRAFNTTLSPTEISNLLVIALSTFPDDEGDKKLGLFALKLSGALTKSKVGDNTDSSEVNSAPGSASSSPGYPVGTCAPLNYLFGKQVEGPPTSDNRAAPPRKDTAPQGQWG